MNTKPSLLIVEDDLDNQKLLNMFLKRFYEVSICDSSDSFYKMVDGKIFDIIIMDISLNGQKDGLQLTSEIRAHPKLRSIPIVALSAHAFQKDKDNAYKAGVDLYLTKPTPVKHLLESLEKILLKKTK